MIKNGSRVLGFDNKYALIDPDADGDCDFGVYIGRDENGGYVVKTDNDHSYENYSHVILEEKVADRRDEMLKLFEDDIDNVEGGDVEESN